MKNNSYDIEKSLMNLPTFVCNGWCKYKGDVFFASINYEASLKAKQPMINLHYCATKCLNNIIEKTVAYAKWKFKEHKFQA